MLFTALDGKMFDTQEECAQYEANPTVWIVQKSSPFIISANKIFLTEEEADLYAEEMNNSDECDFGVLYRTKVFIIEPYKPALKPQTTVFNIEKPYVEQEGLAAKRENMWQKILKVLNLKKDEK